MPERNQEADGSATDDEHLADLVDGAGCTEIWEHLSATRDENERKSRAP